MKKTHLLSFVSAAALIAAIQFTSCKSKQSNEGADTATVKMDTPATTAPVTIATDDQLATGVKDATKDFPGVTATVDKGEISLTGNITRDKLPTLMMALNSLHPKKINNNLTINK